MGKQNVGPSKESDEVKILSVRISGKLHVRLRAAAHIQKHSESRLASILIEWALPFYEALRWIETLLTLNYQYAVSKCPELLGKGEK